MDVQREGNVHCQNNTAVLVSYHREKNYQTREQKLTLSYQSNPLSKLVSDELSLRYTCIIMFRILSELKICLQNNARDARGEGFFPASDFSYLAYKIATWCLCTT